MSRITFAHVGTAESVSQPTFDFESGTSLTKIAAKRRKNAAQGASLGCEVRNARALKGRKIGCDTDSAALSFQPIKARLTAFDAGRLDPDCKVEIVTCSFVAHLTPKTSEFSRTLEGSKHISPARKCREKWEKRFESRRDDRALTHTPQSRRISRAAQSLFCLAHIRYTQYPSQARDDASD